jgi:hypothetical protein
MGTTAMMTAQEGTEAGKSFSPEQFWAVMERFAAEAAERQKEFDRLQVERQKEFDRPQAKWQKEAEARQKEFDRLQVERQKEAKARQKEFDRLLAERQKEAEARQKEADRRLAEWRAETDRQQAKREKEAEARQKEFDRQQVVRRKEAAEQSKELKRLHEKTERAFEKSAAQIEKNSKQLGEINNRFGQVAEHMVAPNLVDKFHEMKFEFSKAGRNLKFKDRKHGIFMEVDVFLEDGDKVMAVETKVTPSIDDVARHVERMEKLRRYADVRGDSRTYLGAIAGVVIEKGVRECILANGFYLVEPSGDTFNIIAPKGEYHPCEW